jgi:hypothetical protein
MNGERRLSGVIESAGPDTFLLRLANGEERIIPYDQIDRAKTIFVWEAQAKPSNKNGKGTKAGGKGTKKTGAAGTPKSSGTSSSAASTADSEQEIDDFLDRNDDLEDLDAELDLDTDNETDNETDNYIHNDDDQESSQS